MKYKLAIIFSLLSWFFVYILSLVFKPYYLEDFQYINVFVPLSIILVTTVFGILYIREFDKNEVKEGFLFGVLLFIIDFILDFIHVTLMGSSMTINNEPSHIISMLILFPLITTLLGYLSQMKIELN